MVASSSNLLLVASSPRENRHGYMIRSTSTNNISGISGTNLKDTIMLETVAAPVYASATSASATSASTTPPSATKSEEKPRPRPRRKKMASTGVDTMKKMLVTSSSVVVALPESPTLVSRKHEREQRDDIESVFNNIRSTSSRKVLSFSMETPSMPDIILMPTLPAPDVNRNSKVTNEMSNNDNTAPMKKKKKNHMGRRLRQLKKRLSYKSKSGSKSSPSNQVEEKEEVCLSHGITATTSATTSTLSFGPSSSEEDDVPFMDTMDMLMTMNITTTLKPRVRSMFHEEEEMMMPMMPVLLAPPCPLSSATDDAAVVAVTTIPFASFYSKLDKALPVFSPNEGDDDGDDDVGADDIDEWGVFTSYDEDEEEEHHESEDQTHNDRHKFKPFSRSSFTKHTSHPCFQPRAHLPVVVFAPTAGAE